MTGLEPEKDHILEVACLVTDSWLNIIAEGPDIAIYQPPEVLTTMTDPWSINQHGKVSQSTIYSERADIYSRLPVIRSFQNLFLGRMNPSSTGYDTVVLYVYMC